MDKKELLKYIYNNYKNIDINKEYDKVIEFVNIFINDELYKKNRNQTKLEAFITLYAKVKAREKGFDYKVETTCPKNSKKKFKVTKFIDTWDRKISGTCNKDRINIQLTNYLIKSLYTDDKHNFATLIETINHELKHANNHVNGEIKYDILTKENYYELKFHLLQREAPAYYYSYYSGFEEEIGAFEAGYQSVAELYKETDRELATMYQAKANNIKSYRCTEYYDNINIDCIDRVMEFDYVKEGENYNKNKKHFLIEYDEKGLRRNVGDIIDAKYDQLNRLNNEIVKNPDDLYLIDILVNNKTEEVFNEMGYISIIKDLDFINYINDDNKKDALNMIEYGINKTRQRLNENSAFTPDLQEKYKNHEYLNNRIKVLEEKKEIINNKYDKVKTI